MKYPNPFTPTYAPENSASHDKPRRDDRIIPNIPRLADDVVLSLCLYPTPKPRHGPNLDVVVRQR
jgi:hypothetical protein